MTDQPKPAVTMREIRERLGHVEPGQPEPIIQATRFTVNCLPEDGIDSHVFEITVEYRGDNRWAVKRHSQCLAADGTWDYEMRPSERDDDWLGEHRFDLDTALKLAKEAAPLVTVNGFTVADALQMAQQRSEADRG